MAPLPAPGTSAPPTGNALSDANAQSQPTLTPAQLQAVGIGLSGTTTSQGSDCLWPPPGMFGIGTGIFSLALGVHCLFTKSEARAVLGAGILVAGFILVNWGIGMMVGVEVLGVVSGLTGRGGSRGGGGAAAASSEAAGPEVALAA